MGKILHCLSVLQLLTLNRALEIRFMKGKTWTTFRQHVTTFICLFPPLVFNLQRTKIVVYNKEVALFLSCAVTQRNLSSALLVARNCKYFTDWSLVTSLFLKYIVILNPWRYMENKLVENLRNWRRVLLCSFLVPPKPCTQLDTLKHMWLRCLHTQDPTRWRSICSQSCTQKRYHFHGMEWVFLGVKLRQV